MTSIKKARVVQVSKFDLFDSCSVKSTQDLTQQVCQKISKLNREIEADEVYSTLLKGGRVYTTSSYYQIH